jgi:hypothetical protein
MQLGRVFISSVFGGMMPLRKTAAEAARLVGLVPVGAEDHIAQTGNVRDTLARELAACDTYVGMFDPPNLPRCLSVARQNRQGQPDG